MDLISVWDVSIHNSDVWVSGIQERKDIANVVFHQTDSEKIKDIKDRLPQKYMNNIREFLVINLRK